jgi:hypothetical protein
MSLGDIYTALAALDEGWADDKDHERVAAIVASFTGPIVWPLLIRLSDASLKQLEKELVDGGDLSSYDSLRRKLSEMSPEERLVRIVTFCGEHLKT